MTDSLSSSTTKTQLITDYDGEFRRKKVLITGASGIVGGWISDAFARRGSDLFLTDIRTESLNTQLKNGRWQDVDVTIHASELQEQLSMSELVATVKDKWGSPDILVNNAGIYPHKPLLDVDLSEWKLILDVNVTAPFFLTNQVAKLMVAQSIGGSIVNILSGASVTVSKNGVPYSVSKAALAMLTRGAALELAEFDIRVNGVAPGFAPGSEVSPLDEEYVNSMVRSIPLRRSSGPMDSPEAVLFLCSSRASFITGSVLTVDGGRTAGPVSR